MNIVDIKSEYSIRDSQISIKWYLAIFIHFTIVSLLLIIFYQHQIDSDGISYISLANKYLTGDFKNAVTGHWSPMISWVLLPFLYFKLEPMLAYRIASSFIGIVTLVGIDRVFLDLHLKKQVRIFYLFSLSPVVLWYAESDIGADLLGACVLIYYVHTVLRDNYLCSKYAGMLSGLIGALAYFAKNYNFYFFILHFTCISFCYWITTSNKSQKRIVLNHFISGFLVFTIVSGVWVALVSYKYHKFSPSTAGAMSLLLIKVGPGGYPMLTDGLFPPPNATAISVWEDPAIIKLKSWSPLDSTDDFVLYLKTVLKNIRQYLWSIVINYVYDLTLLYLVIMAFVFKKRLETKINYILLTILLYPIGYMLLYYDGQRYVLINIILLYVLSAWVVNKIFIKHGTVKTVRLCVPVILYVSLVSLTLIRINRDYRFAVPALNSIYTTSEDIKKIYHLENKNIASQDGNWNHTLDLSYFLGSRYFGRIKDHTTNADLRKELLDMKIQYYFVFGKLKNDLDILKYEKEFSALPDGLTIYKVVSPQI